MQSANAPIITTRASKFPLMRAEVVRKDPRGGSEKQQRSSERELKGSRGTKAKVKGKIPGVHVNRPSASLSQPHHPQQGMMLSKSTGQGAACTREREV